MLYCWKCKKLKPSSDFYFNNSYCKSCEIERINRNHQHNLNRNNYHKNYKQKQSKKYGINWNSFHVRATQYAKYHHLFPRECPICGEKGKICLHHPFYRNNEDWKYIVFCCQSCHSDIHIWKKKCPKFIDLKLLSRKS